MSTEVIELIEKNLDTFKLVYNNRSISSMSSQFKQDLKTIARLEGINYCSSCNNSITNAIIRIYNNYNKQLNLNNNGRKKRNSGKKTQMDNRTS